jgi:uncharacterized protein (TIGR03435 family)
MTGSRGTGLVVLMACCSIGFGQQANGPAFDAASVRPSAADAPHPPYRFDGGGFSGHGFLMHFIESACDVEDYQVIGGPAWIRTDWYDVQAKPAGTSTKPQIREMLQTLLAERFQLKIHRETRMMQGYVLTVEKGGAKLPSPRMDVPPDSTGVVQVGGGELWYRASTLDHIATGLRLELSQPVVNQTGIEGHYDLKLRFDEQNAELKDPKAPPQTGPGIGSVFTALHEFGMKLESKKVPIEVVVVDSAERPSEN